MQMYALPATVSHNEWLPYFLIILNSEVILSWLLWESCTAWLEFMSYYRFEGVQFRHHRGLTNLGIILGYFFFNFGIHAFQGMIYS
jgi:hypothetical protein